MEKAHGSLELMLDGVRLTDSVAIHYTTPLG
jgi:hypothetical protein